MSISNFYSINRGGLPKNLFFYETYPDELQSIPLYRAFNGELQDDKGSTTTVGMSGIPEAETACSADFCYKTCDQILRLLAHGLEGITPTPIRYLKKFTENLQDLRCLFHLST